MARSEFGRTWWGSAWIEALEKSEIDRMRLDEGKLQASKGNVKEVKIENREILAFVLDQEETFRSKIRLVEFTEEEKQQVKNIIKENPSLVSDLSLGRLPEKILELMNEKGIPLFPSNWQRVISSCTCRENVNPCRHRAAVYYLFANEVDKNPSLLFNLRGITTESFMESAGIVSIEKISREEDDEFIPWDKVRLNASIPEETEPDLAFDDLNIRSLFTLLPDNPLFYNEANFKLILIEKYKSLTSFAETINIEDEINPSLKRLDIYCLIKDKKKAKTGCTEPETVFLFSPETYVSGIKTKDEPLLISMPEVSSGGLSQRKRKMKVAERDDVMNYFLSLPLNLSKESSSPSVRFLNLASSIALALVKTFSFIPELSLYKDNSFHIRYMPLLHDEKTQAAMGLLSRLAPVNIIFRGSDLAAYKEPGTFFLSEFITYIVHQHEARLGRNFFFLDQKIYNAFFKGERFKAEKFEEESYAKAVLNWLERLTFRERTFQPVVTVKSISSDKYSVQVEIKDKQKEKSKPLPLSKLFEEKESLFGLESEIARTELLREIKIASEYFPQLNTVLNSMGQELGIITSEEIFDFITRTSDTLNLLGLKVVLPENIKNLAQPRLILTAKERNHEEALTYFSMKDLLEFQWKVAIGDTIITAEEFRKMAEVSRGIVKLKESYFLLDPEKAKNILTEIERKAEDLSPKDILQAFLTGEFQGKKFIPAEAASGRLGELLKHEDVTYPEELHARLRPYQKTGFRWLYTNVIKGFGCCLADDMGLGKTVEVIALLLRFKEEGRLTSPALVVCPTTVVGNWYKEFMRFAPRLKVFVYHGAQRRLTLKNIDVVVTTYGTLRSDEEKFGKYTWSFGIIDEAQNIKNPDAEQTRAVKSVRAVNRVAMSGTPVQNRMTELWSIFDFINNGYLGSLGSFKKNYSMPIEKYRDKEKISKLRKITSPFILRRLKTDEKIIRDLPDKFIFDEYCYLTKDQAVLYEQVVKSAMGDLRLNKGSARKGVIFKLITELKEICNHPSQYKKEDDYRSELSGKSEKTVELLRKMLNYKEKILIFTQYKEMGDILATMTENELNENTFFFHGSLTRSQRDKMVSDFQEKPERKIMIVSLKAGGTGLNLTAAARVIHYDLWWNPAVETQATDRTYRIGQKKNVTVHRLITLGTFEEKIDDMIKQKKELSDLTLAVGESWITELSERELKKIFSL
ncbi:MAG TPA: DEAD/DEAH box helicase [Ignavibacteriales bacterium]|nr:DEAD/DEAH box helicase [Ignavibacteriales bacterium]